VLDLERVAANPKLVVRFEPEDSRLWALVRDNEMPPQGARAGSLMVDEKEAIRAWIAVGAPAASSQPSAGITSSVAPANEGTPSEPLRRSLVRRTLRWLGQFHILVIHFPIALLLAAAAGEMWSAWRGMGGPSPAAERFCVLLGAAGAVSAAALGWLHADFGGYGAGAGRILVLHRWVGTAAGLCALAAALLSERDAHRQRRSLLFRITFWTSNLLVAAAGHFGGTLVHGDDFLNW
jgi:hypothetical protein